MLRLVGSMLASGGRWVSTHKILAAAVLLILTGLGLWTYVGTRYEGGGDRVRDIQQELDARWNDPGSGLGEAVAEGAEGATPPDKQPDEVVWGDLVARMSIERLGLTWYVVEGVNADDIASAPGHYPGTAMPGKKGNFAVAGHREHGLFWDIDQMRVGDVIQVETRNYVYAYRVTDNPEITSPDAWQQVAPVPPGAFKSGDKLLTLTTCDPKWDNYHRLIIHAKLISSSKKTS